MAKGLTLTVQAEYVRPFLVSFQHPPLLISHRPDPEATVTKAHVNSEGSSDNYDVQQSHLTVLSNTVNI
jgi:hypothetical protein